MKNLYKLYNKLKTFLVIFLFLFILFCNYGFFFNNLKNEQSDLTDNLKFVYISDLNLYPTPLVSQRIVHPAQKKLGLLIYESQAVFLDLIRYLNQKISPELVIFGGNNIYYNKDTISDFNDENAENLWHLFLDMASEIKGDVLLIFGATEVNSIQTEELINGLGSFNIHSEDLWWSKQIKNILFIGLDSTLLATNNKASKDQISDLQNTLNLKKNLVTVLALNDSLLLPDRSINQIQYQKLLLIIKANPQIKLVLGGNQYISRVKISDGVVFLTSPSPMSYPCAFNLIEISPTKLKVSTLTIPLKGIVKKAERLLIESDRAIVSTKLSPKDYAKGLSSDTSFEICFESLSNR